MNTKKILALVLMLVLICTLAACGAKDDVATVEPKNAEEAVAAICGKITACNMRPLVSAAECGIFVLIGKQGGQALDLGFGGDPGA